MRHIVGIILGCGLLFSAPQMSNAKSLRQVRAPAEFPPASFKGKQYVDSRGCVFIRAGFGGQVTWVPRVNRQRKVYCSKKNKPSLSASQLAALGKRPVIVEPAAPAVVKKRPVRKVVAKPAQVVRSAKPVRVLRKPVYVAQKPVVVQKTVKVVKTAPRRVVAKPKPVRKLRSYRKSRNGRLAIRRTPQPVHPGDLVRSRRLRAAAAANETVYSNPQPVVYSRKKATGPIRTRDAVHGLRTVGTIIDPDVTASGDAQMELVWTNTVPRRLIQRKIRVRRVAAAPVVKRQYSAAQPRVRMSSKSRYVQVATFGVAANAAKTVRRFQSSGLPVSSRRSVRSGKAYKVVYLGPFNSSAQLQNAMSAARSAGFRDAIYR